MSGRPIGDIGENELSDLFLFRAEEFFSFTENPINGLSWARIQAEPT